MKKYGVTIETIAGNFSYQPDEWEHFYSDRDDHFFIVSNKDGRNELYSFDKIIRIIQTEVSSD